MDFTQAYLNTPLKETIYVTNPDGSKSPKYGSVWA